MADNDGLGLRLAWAQTIGTFVGLLAIALAFVALLIERVRRVRAGDERRFTSEDTVLGCFHAKPVSRWSSLWGGKTETLRLPTLAGLIEVGDKGAWTSSALDLMTETHPKESWVKLYESVMTSIASNARLLEKDWKDEEEPIPTFLRRIRGEHHQKHHASTLWNARQNAYQAAPGKLLSIHRQPEAPLSVNIQVQNASAPSQQGATAPPTAQRNGKRGLSRLTWTWIVRDKACIGVTREELAALIIIMGVALPRPEHYPYVSGVGGFGLSVDINHADAAWSISIIQGSRLARHAPSMGSGYTTLMAKHLACGSIPFAKNQSWILSVYLTDKVLDTLKAGGHVIDKRAFGGDALEFLRRLPGDKLIDAFYGTEDALAADNSSAVPPNRQRLEPGSILHADRRLAGKWSRAVTGIAFGGLVPQASPNVVSAAKFTVGGSNLNGCVENLELLIDELHRLDKDAALFGENVQERCHASGHAFVNYTFPSENSNPTDASAIFSRYSNLLERVVALTVGQPSGDTEAPLDAAGKETQCVNGQDIFEATASHIQSVYEASVALDRGCSNNTATSGSILAKQDLGKVLEDVITNINSRAFIPLSDCTAIIRCVLAAWAFTVPLIEVKQAAGPATSAAVGKIPNEIVLANLPPVSSLC